MAEDLKVRLDSKLAEVGSVLDAEGVLAVDDFVVGDRVFSAPEGIEYELTITNAGETILAMGGVEAELVGTCDRCLEEARLHLTGEVDALFADDPDSFDEGDDEEEIEVLPIVEDTIDLTLPVRSAIAVEIPFKVLCKPDCKGLCPHCGQNLNVGACDCEERLAEEGDPMNPMSALKAFKTKASAQS